MRSKKTDLFLPLKAPGATLEALSLPQQDPTRDPQALQKHHERPVPIKEKTPIFEELRKNEKSSDFGQKRQCNNSKTNNKTFSNLPATRPDGRMDGWVDKED